MRPVIEKKKFGIIHIIYIVLILVCIIAIGIAVYAQYFKDEKLGVIFGITEDVDEEYISLKENFLNIFTNDITVLKPYSSEIEKIKTESDVVILAYDKHEENENYIINLKIPYFNIKSENAIKINQEIKSIFKDKSESILSLKNNNKSIYSVKYKVYVEDEIVSLIILSELKEGNSNQRIIIQAYNYNLAENRLINVDDLISKKKIDIQYANAKIRDEVNSSQEQNIKLNELGYNVNIRNTNEDIYKIENAEVFFIGEKGYMYVIYPYGNSEFTSEIDVIIFR